MTAQRESALEAKKTGLVILRTIVDYDRNASETSSPVHADVLAASGQVSFPDGILKVVSKDAADIMDI